MSASPAHPDFIVATNGNDAWSGRIEIPASDGKDGPFLTVARAQQAVRALRQAEPDRHREILVQLRDGSFPLTAPLRFTPEDFGSSNAPAVFAAAPGATPVISGGVRLTGWRVDEQGRWILQLPEVKAGSWNFTQLFVNGQRRLRPRLPKQGYHWIAEGLSPSPAAQNRGDDRFRFAPGEFQANWKNLVEVEVLAFQVWTMSRLRIASVDEAERIVTFTGTTRNTGWASQLSVGRRFIIENVQEALSEPGEWYLDRPSGTLTYLPKLGEDPEPNGSHRASGGNACPASGRSRRRTLCRTSRIPQPGVCPRQLDHVPARQRLSSGRCVPRRSFRRDRRPPLRLGRLPLRARRRLCDRVERRCKDNEVRDCVLTDLGGGGVKIGEIEFGKEELQASHIVVSNCLIQAGGRLHASAIGVWIGHAHHNAIEHCTIRDFYYSGISLGWTWGYGDNGAHHNRAEANHISDIGQHVRSDLGAIYSLGVSPGTIYRGNFVHDVNAFEYGGWGIYFDEGSAGILARGERHRPLQERRLSPELRPGKHPGTECLRGWD